MASLQRCAASPRCQRGTAFSLRGVAFPLSRSIFMRGLHFKRRTSSRQRLLNRARFLFGLLTSSRLMRGSPAEISAWLEIHLATQARHIPPALRALFIFDTATEKREDLPTFVEDNCRLRMSIDPGRGPTAAVVEWFTNLHSLGFSLSGNFNATDFALNHSELLRGQRKLLMKLRKLTLKRRRRDMASCADMIFYGFYNIGYGIMSLETKHLVSLLKHFKPRYSFLVRNHACHENEAGKVALFEIMCNRLHVLEKIDKPKYKKIDKPKYNRIMGKIRCCRKFSIGADIYLAEVLEYQNQMEEEGVADPVFLVELQKAMDEEGELAGLGCHIPSLGIRLLHEEE